MEKMTRKEQKEKTRAGLVGQAETLFALNGISSTTTADIAKALKVSHGTLFVHFSTREDLIKAVVDEFGEKLSTALGARCSSDLKLRDLLKAHLSVLAEYEDFYMRLVSESQSLPPHIRSILYSMNASLSYRFYRAAKAEMDKGVIKKMTQVHFFNTWMGLVHYYILNRDLFSERTPILVEVGEDLLRHFFHLIKT
ncbi:MAG: TetR/AcrR family transcriptional regulator [Bdellovibrionales bacterium]|nr:TetR/AcrR family transcriptional regulator [Bdellovibrionales bacterium]